MFKLILISFFLASCSSVQHKKDNNFTDERVSSFMKGWKKDKAQVDEATYKRTYGEYLESVRKVFVREGMAKNIDYYLDTLTKMDHNVDLANENYDGTTPGSTERTKVVIGVYDKLLEERSYKLLNNYGFNFYSELMKNRNEFIEKNGREFDFPL